MNPNTNQRRPAWLQRESDVSVVPVLLLCAACAVAVLMHGVGALLDETAPVRAAEPAEQRTRPAT